MNVLFKMQSLKVIEIERKKKADAEAKIKAIEESHYKPLFLTLSRREAAQLYISVLLSSNSVKNTIQQILYKFSNCRKHRHRPCGS
jgi:hypothetical protein